jgi:hypothetical protein
MNANFSCCLTNSVKQAGWMSRNLRYEVRSTVQQFQSYKMTHTKHPFCLIKSAYRKGVAKVAPLLAMEALRGERSIASTHSLPRH